MTNTETFTENKKYNMKEIDSVHRLYLGSEHVLGNEICELMGTHIANISNLKSENIIKIGRCPILSKNDLQITRKIRNTMFDPRITSLENKIPLTYFRSEYKMNENELKSTIAEDIEEIAGKKFIVYKQEFLDKIKQPNNIDNLIYVCDKTEFEELQLENVIKYHYKINDKKYLVIY